ncbi:MAG TPA: hypothetical protein VF486_25205 [Actinomycetes bacterium]
MDGEGAREQRLGVVEVALGAQHDGEAVQAPGGVGVAGAHLGLEDAQGHRALSYLHRLWPYRDQVLATAAKPANDGAAG